MQLVDTVATDPLHSAALFALLFVAPALPPEDNVQRAVTQPFLRSNLAIPLPLGWDFNLSTR